MAVRFDRGKWWAHASYKGRRLSKSCATEEEARTAEQQLLKQLGRQEAIAKAPADGGMGHLLSICSRLDWSGKTDMIKLGKGVVSYFGQDTLPACIDELLIDRYVEWLRQSGPNGHGCSNSTIRHYLSALSVMLQRAQRLRLITDLPLMPEKRLLPLPEPRSLVISPEWFDCLLDQLERAERRQEQRLSLFLWHMGCRVSEALSLTWSRIDFQARTIQFTKTKGREARRLPLPRPVRELLEPLQGTPGDAVFPFSYATFLAAYKRAVDGACDELGLPPAVRQEWCIHTLRHTCLTRLAQQGWSGPQIQAWGGHQSMQVTQRYVHHSGVTLEHLVEC